MAEIARRSGDAGVLEYQQKGEGLRYRSGQQWLLRSDSGPSFGIDGPLGGAGFVDERNSLMVSRWGNARGSP
jgi:hypothetical protein